MDGVEDLKILVESYGSLAGIERGTAGNEGQILDLVDFFDMGLQTSQFGAVL